MRQFRKRILFISMILISFSVPVTAQEQVHQAKQQASNFIHFNAMFADFLLERIAAKICYSWSKSGQYFNLAITSVTHNFFSKQNALKSQAKEQFSKKAAEAADSMIAQGRQNLEKVQEKAGTALNNEVRDFGSGLKKEAENKIRNTQDSVKK